MSLLGITSPPYELQTALTGYDLKVLSFAGEEAISRLFQFRLRVSVEPRLTIAQLLGQNVTFQMNLRPGTQRRFLAKIRSVEDLGTDEHNRALYNLDLVPRFWNLTQTVRARIFADKSPTEIIGQVFAGTGIKIITHTRAGEKVRPYCVQYFESDFDFVARLLEEEGYIYRCGIDADQPAFFIDCLPASFPTIGPIPFHEVTGSTEDRIGSWQKTRILAATQRSGRDHFFESNSPLLQGVADVPQTSPAIPGWESLNTAWSAPVQQYPGNWAHLFEEVSRSGATSTPTGYTDFGNNRMWYALQQSVGFASACEGESNCPQIASGSIFTLTNHTVSSGDYLVVSVRHKGTQPFEHSSTSQEDAFTYENQFVTVPHGETMMYLPPRVTRKPVINGCQTAIVVTSPSEHGWEPISTDRYGRVQVKFWWDASDTPSCWIRVAAPWAGDSYGWQHVPRHNQEVVVTFEDGDPDRPLIVGSVYNAMRTHPFPLQWQSGIRSRTMGADGVPGNELRFCDRPGQEEIYIHAEKDRNEVVDNDATRKVGNDSADLVSNDSYEAVGNDVHITTANEKREVIGAKSSLTVGDDCMNAFAKKLGIAATEIHLKASKIVLEADSITIRTTDKGREFIELVKGGGIIIEGKGAHVSINCDGGSPEDGCFTMPSQPVNPFDTTE